MRAWKNRMLEHSAFSLQRRFTHLLYTSPQKVRIRGRRSSLLACAAATRRSANPPRRNVAQRPPVLCLFLRQRCLRAQHEATIYRAIYCCSILRVYLSRWRRNSHSVYLLPDASCCVGLWCSWWVMSTELLFFCAYCAHHVSRGVTFHIVHFSGFLFLFAWQRFISHHERTNVPFFKYM